MSSRLFHRGKLLVTIFAGCISMVVLLALGVIVLRSLLAAHQGSIAVIPSRQTTYLTGPLRADGSVDYVAALNERYGQGVTPENNAAVLIWQAIGPQLREADTRDAYFKALGIATPAADSDYFIDFEKFASRQSGAGRQAKVSSEDQKRRVEELEHQSELAMRRTWTEEEFPLLADWLKANEKPLEIAVRATWRPRFFDPLVVSPDAEYALVLMLLPLISECRELAKALIVRAMLYSANGQIDEARQDLLALHRLGRLVAQGPSLVEWLVGVAVSREALESQRAMLQQVRLSSTQITGINDDLDGLPQFSPVVERLDIHERFECLDGVYSVAREMSRTKAAGRKTDGSLQQLLTIARNLQVDWNLVFAEVNGWWDRQIAASRLPTRAMRKAALDELEHEFDMRTGDAMTIVESIKTVLGNRRIASERMANLFLALFLPALSAAYDAEERGQMHLDLTKLACALALYRVDHGDYPAALSDLTPVYLDEVAEEFFGGGPLRYVAKDGGYMLHSAGPDGVFDETPEIDREEVGFSDDVIVRMPAAAPLDTSQ